MKNAILISIVALSVGVIAAPDVQADKPQAVLCNNILADGLGTAQQIVVQEQLALCEDFTLLFFEFGLEGCFGLFAAGELNGVGGQASIQPGGPDEGEVKNLGDQICGAVAACGLCEQAVMAGVCGQAC